MSVPASRFHIPRGSTRASDRRKRQRERSNIDNVGGDIVSAINGVVGSATIVAGAGISVSGSGQNITIASTGGTPSAAHACRVYNPTPTSFNENTLTPITAWGTESYDIDGWHSPSVNPDRITVDRNGIYLVEVKCDWNINPAGFAEIVLNKNGSQLVASQVPSLAVLFTLHFSTVLALVAADYLTVSLLKSNAGAAQSIAGSGEYDCYFSVSLIGTN